ncbi:MAG: AI-2E family transporter [Acidobacteriota bacterium]|nr:MAG: AI-2E family transporter [Acidobacteriota bacterium]
MRVEALRMLLGLAALAAVLIGVLSVLSPFATPIVWALILGTATWPLYRRLRRRIGMRHNVAALAMTTLLLLLVLVPTGLLSLALVQELEPGVAQLRKWASTGELELPQWIGQIPLAEELLRDWFFRFTDAEAREEWLRGAAGRVQEVVKLGRNLLHQVINLMLTVFTLFFVYRDGDALLAEVRLLVERVGGERGLALIQAVRETVSAVFYGWLMTAAAQGLVSMIGYWLVGLQAPVLLGVLTGLLAVIPFGVGLVFVPLILMLAFAGAWGKALVLTAWSFLFVSLIDNFLRPLFISGPSRIPFILVFFGVLGGLATFGLMGLVLGPVLLAVVLALWRQAGDVLASEPAVTDEDGDAARTDGAATRHP